MGRCSRWPLAESALRIDIRELSRRDGKRRRGVFSPGIPMSGVTIDFSSGGQIRLDFSFGVTYSCMRLRYHTDDLGSFGEAVRTPQAADETITLERFPQPLGGARWYFRCPTSNRRCQVLYLPRGAVGFARGGAFAAGFSTSHSASHVPGGSSIAPSSLASW